MNDAQHNDCVGFDGVKHRVRKVSGDCSPDLPMDLWVHFRSRNDPCHPFPDAGLEARFELRRDPPVGVTSMPDLGSGARPDHNPERHPSPNNSRSTSAHGTLLSGFSRCASRSRSSSSRSCCETGKFSRSRNRLFQIAETSSIRSGTERLWISERSFISRFYHSAPSARPARLLQRFPRIAIGEICRGQCDLCHTLFSST